MYAHHIKEWKVRYSQPFTPGFCLKKVFQWNKLSLGWKIKTDPLDRLQCGLRLKLGMQNTQRTFIYFCNLYSIHSASFTNNSIGPQFDGFISICIYNNQSKLSLCMIYQHRKDILSIYPFPQCIVMHASCSVFNSLHSLMRLLSAPINYVEQLIWPICFLCP